MENCEDSRLTTGLTNFKNTENRRGIPAKTEELRTDYHRTAYKFLIIGKTKAHLPGRTRMVNWDKEWVENDNARIEKTTRHLIVRVKRRRISTGSEGVALTGEEIVKVAIGEALKVAHQLDVLIGEAQPMTKEIKVLSPILKGAPMFQTDKVKNVYPSGEPEFIDPKSAEKHAINFMNNMAMLNKVPQLEGYLEQFGKQLMLHLEAIEGIKSGVNQLSVAVERLNAHKPSFRDRLNSLFRVKRNGRL